MSPRGRRGRGGSRGGRGPGRIPAQGQGGPRPVTEMPHHEEEPLPEGEPRPIEDEDELVEDEIRAHREIAADSKPAPGAGPQAVASFAAFLRALGIDSKRDPEYTATAQLTADFLAERTAALRREPAPLRPSRYRGSAGETVRLERIPVYGMCPHHLVPYFGSVARLVRELSCVPRLQESFTQAIADAIERDLGPASVEVTVRARHLCLEMRGVEQKALFVTEARRGGPGPPGAPRQQKPHGRR